MPKIIHLCPTEDYTCPNWRDGICILYNPAVDCDDYAFYLGEEDDEEE